MYLLFQLMNKVDELRIKNNNNKDKLKQKTKKQKKKNGMDAKPFYPYFREP